ncbi:hypothetical protein MIR68_003349 [Amoeboaphelidium protococcarum]|nr:hypothetical protein MIR68_003349 [Amoeboaphelidium protococcarum]
MLKIGKRLHSVSSTQFNSIAQQLKKLTFKASNALSQAQQKEDIRELLINLGRACFHGRIDQTANNGLEMFSEPTDCITLTKAQAAQRSKRFLDLYQKHQESFHNDVALKTLAGRVMMQAGQCSGAEDELAPLSQVENDGSVLVTRIRLLAQNRKFEELQQLCTEWLKDDTLCARQQDQVNSNKLKATMCEALSKFKKRDATLFDRLYSDIMGLPDLLHHYNIKRQVLTASIRTSADLGDTNRALQKFATLRSYVVDANSSYQLVAVNLVLQTFSNSISVLKEDSEIELKQLGQQLSEFYASIQHQSLLSLYSYTTLLNAMLKLRQKSADDVVCIEEFMRVKSDMEVLGISPDRRVYGLLIRAWRSYDAPEYHAKRSYNVQKLMKEANNRCLS